MTPWGHTIPTIGRHCLKVQQIYVYCTSFPELLLTCRYRNKPLQTSHALEVMHQSTKQLYAASGDGTLLCGSSRCYTKSDMLLIRCKTVRHKPQVPCCVDLVLIRAYMQPIAECCVCVVERAGPAHPSLHCGYDWSVIQQSYPADALRQLRMLARHSFWSVMLTLLTSTPGH